MTADRPLLTQLNLVVGDPDKTVAFYRLLGLVIEANPGSEHVAVPLPNGVLLEFDSVNFVPTWDSGWKGATAGAAVLGFSLASRESVDTLYSELTDAGYAGHQRPYDAFWGARYAIVDDPDGNPVGLMSPIDDERKSWPPSPPDQ
jgi:catechol 2,3-dioxygenase-like lactoylglutathione lyase family enzyme